MDQGRHAPLRVDGEEVGAARLLAVEAEAPRLVGERLVLERQHHPPGEGRVAAEIEDECQGRTALHDRDLAAVDGDRDGQDEAHAGHDLRREDVDADGGSGGHWGAGQVEPDLRSVRR